MNFFTKYGLALALSAFCWLGCGVDDGSGVGGGHDKCGADGSGASCKTVAIGGLTWMAENLNREMGDSWCYDNKESNCDKYGRLYDFNTAMEVCPSGWRLPEAAEWSRLAAAVGGREVAGKILKSANGWYGGGNGTDDSSFSALPGGYRGARGTFYHAGDYGIWWTATVEDIKDARCVAMDYGNDYVSESYHDKGFGRSVRCVKR